MDVSLIADTVAVATTTQGLGSANSINHCNNLIANSNLGLSSKFLQLSAVIFDVIAPPAVKSSSVRTIRKTNLLKKRRTRRKTYTDGESGDGGDAGEELAFFGGDGGGPIGGGGGGGSWVGGGGGGWNFHRFGGQNWDEWSWSPSSEFAYGFFYEVIYWIALSTCLHFAFEKVVRMMSGGVADSDREKGSMRLASVC